MNFIQKNKVFLLGLIGAIALSLQQFTSSTAIDWKVIAYAAIMAALSYIARKWRGQGMSILGIFGTLAGAFVQVHETGHFTWDQFFFSALMALISSATGPVKSVGYEKTTTIENAKANGKEITKTL